jgi:prophage regulatory protein
MNLIPAKTVASRLSVSRATLYRLISANLFPPPIRLSARRVAWAEAAVDAWVASREGR